MGLLLCNMNAKWIKNDSKREITKRNEVRIIAAFVPTRRSIAARGQPKDSASSPVSHRHERRTLQKSYCDMEIQSCRELFGDRRRCMTHPKSSNSESNPLFHFTIKFFSA
ncbi:hypothetical protein Tcan_10729 [Toxocara canis]|uniref:Uncharacterized protein n=1 Tax=Toxocara canis TaxID=6265 RepID=A0A0B2VDM5_TOXCA|nr:hypothetical protein Tcan_10729 [Toxocara canis]